MKRTHIKQYLASIGVDVNDINLGLFDYVGYHTALRWRSPDSEEFKRFGMFYRSSYERAILVYYLIKSYKLESLLEVGFGRGCVSVAAAMAFNELGRGKVTSIDPVIDEQHMRMLKTVFTDKVVDRIELIRGTSSQVLPSLSQKYGIVYVDGDHSYVGTKSDIELTRDKVGSFLLMDDYHLPTKVDPGIDCRKAIDEIDWKSDDYFEPELLIMDRRIFMDERSYPDEKIDYGQVIFAKSSHAEPNDDTHALNVW